MKSLQTMGLLALGFALLTVIILICCDSRHGDLQRCAYVGSGLSLAAQLIGYCAALVGLILLLQEILARPSLAALGARCLVAALGLLTAGQGWPAAVALVAALAAMALGELRPAAGKTCPDDAVG